MILRNLYIEDFGIIQQQRLEEINPGLNIIAGPNRAGKTTLLQVLRYLGYEFPRTDILPPPRIKYQLRADVETEDFGVATIRREGFSDPVVKSVSDEVAITLQELYHVNRFTYHQLFTISLQELQRLPGGVERKAAKELQTVLLGAGLRDLADLPEIAARFAAAADTIGGKYGKPDVGGLKHPWGKINDGLDLLNTARSQLETYQQKSEELNQKNGQLNKLNDEIGNLRLQRDRLEFLTTNMETFQVIRELKEKLDKPENQNLVENFPVDTLPHAESLAQGYSDIVHQAEQAQEDFVHSIPGEDAEPVYDALMEHEKALITWDRQISGLQERTRTFMERREAHRDNARVISAGLQQLNAEWTDDFSVLGNIDTDMIKLGELRQTVDEVHTLTGKLESLGEDIDDLRSHLSEKQAELNKHRAISEVPSRIRLILAITIWIVIGGFTGWHIAIWLGLLFGVGGSLVTLIFLLYPALLQRETATRRSALLEEINSLEKQIESRQVRQDRLRNEYTETAAKLENFRAQLKLPGNTSPGTVLEYFKSAADLKLEILNWHKTEESLKGEEEELREQMGELALLLTSVWEDFGDSYDEKIIDLPKMATHLEEVITWLDLGRALRGFRKKKQQIIHEIGELFQRGKMQLSLEDQPGDESKILTQLEAFIQSGERAKSLREAQERIKNQRQVLRLGITERIEQAFSPVMKGTVKLSDDFERILSEQYAQYISQEEIVSILDKITAQIRSVEENSEYLRKEISRLEVELKELETPDKMYKAQEIIDEGRRELEPLALDYAINRVAEMMAQTVRDRLLDRMYSDLLSGASGLFRQITGGDYQAISPPEDIREPDFVSTTKSGDNVTTTSHLSRGTREQLFFSVRLSRLKGIHPPLPVILDDSLVNFDMEHLHRALQAVSELAGTHQVFILTCHPEIADIVVSSGYKFSAWNIDEGEISPIANPDDVVALLEQVQGW